MPIGADVGTTTASRRHGGAVLYFRASETAQRHQQLPNARLRGKWTSKDLPDDRRRRTAGGTFSRAGYGRVDLNVNSP